MGLFLTSAIHPIWNERDITSIFAVHVQYQCPVAMHEVLSTLSSEVESKGDEFVSVSHMQLKVVMFTKRLDSKPHSYF